MQIAMPVTIIGGYLGSGKTTLINHLLRHSNGARLAILVNDFGDLPIDADLIEAQDGNVISLSGGCICCSYGDDLSLSLQMLREQQSLPDHVLIESSGVALPGAIGRLLSLLPAYQLDCIVVLADASSVQSAVNAKYVGDTIQRQLSDANLIVLNKLDLLSEDKADTVRQWLSENYVHAALIGAEFGRVDSAVFFDMNVTGLSVEDSKLVPEPHRDLSVFSSIKLSIEHMVDAEALASLLADKRCGLVRAKGFVHDTDNTMKTIQVVGSRWSVSDAPEGVSPGVICIACSPDLAEENIRMVCGLDISRPENST